MTAECCNEPTEDCTSGVPTVCNEGCAALFLPVRTLISRLERLFCLPTLVCCVSRSLWRRAVRCWARAVRCTIRSSPCAEPRSTAAATEMDYS